MCGSWRLRAVGLGVTPELPARGRGPCDATSNAGASPSTKPEWTDSTLTASISLTARACKPTPWCWPQDEGLGFTPEAARRSSVGESLGHRQSEETRWVFFHHHIELAFGKTSLAQRHDKRTNEFRRQV